MWLSVVLPVQTENRFQSKLKTLQLRLSKTDFTVKTQESADDCCKNFKHLILSNCLEVNIFGNRKNKCVLNFKTK